MSSAPVCRVRHPAPAFEGTAVLPGGEFGTVKLSDYAGKYVVLAFYPLDFTFVCPTEICQFSDRIEEFRAINTEVIMASVDSKFSHLAWTEQSRREGGVGPLQVPLLSDITKKVARDYGVLVDGDDDEAGVALRGLFIIDGAGTLRQITVNDLPVGRSVDETLRLVQAFQFTDEHGEVCPAGWRPGSQTMKSTPKESKEFFAAGHTDKK